MNSNFDQDNTEIKRKYTPREVGHDDFRKPVKRTNVKRVKKNRPNAGVIIIALLFAVIFAVAIYFIVSTRSKPNTSETNTTAFYDTTDEVTTEDPGYFNINLSKSEMYDGDIILVNSQHQYHFPEDGPVNISANKNDYYQLSSYSTLLDLTVIEAFNTLCTDYYDYNGFQYMQVNSAYRSYEEQVELAKEYTEAYGEEYVKQYVAVPGYSEHHTGLALDLNVNVNGAIYYVESYDDCEWFRDNADEYGFILRYPSDKVYLTGISAESWHYRYVGIPHAKIMESQNLCLEEYTEFIKDFTYESGILGVNDDGTTYTFNWDDDFTGYGVYYAKCEGESTTVSVPSNCEYTVSGNNYDGFIITIHK